jgi:hypothetical protein
MHRSDHRAPLVDGIEYSRVHRSAGVQYDSPVQLFFANPCQFPRNNRDFVIGCGNQDHPRRQDQPRHSGASSPSSDEPNGPPRAWLAAGNDRANLPAQLAQAASQRPSHASRPDDGKAIRHPVLG